MRFGLNYLKRTLTYSSRYLYVIKLNKKIYINFIISCLSVCTRLAIQPLINSMGGTVIETQYGKNRVAYRITIFFLLLFFNAIDIFTN